MNLIESMIIELNGFYLKISNYSIINISKLKKKMTHVIVNLIGTFTSLRI